MGAAERQKVLQKLDQKSVKAGMLNTWMGLRQIAVE